MGGEVKVSSRSRFLTVLPTSHARKMKCDDNNLANLLATAIFRRLNHWSAIDSIIEFHSTETNVSNFKLNATSYTLSIDMLQARPDRVSVVQGRHGPTKGTRSQTN